MKHHLKRAKYIYEERGATDLAGTTFNYIPIELNNIIFKLRHGTGTKVMKEDWDTLILLDGCRYDMFDDRVPFAGNLESRISLGSTSEEFLNQNFGSDEFHDTVYVNSNVYFSKLGLDHDQTFHAVIDLLDEWDEDLEIAHPRTVTEAARETHQCYPNKRVIVHYMQPHLPFIGEIGLEYRKEVGYRNAWIPFRNGEQPITIEELWEGYNENLDVVFDYLGCLLDKISGKVVISSDHGNMVGERQGPIPTREMFGHPWGVYTTELVRVPWFVVQHSNRRSITSESPSTQNKHSEELVKERLRSLGYRD